MEKNWINFNNLPEALFKLFGELSKIKELILESSTDNGVDQLLTIQEASLLLHVQKQTLYSYVSKRVIPFHKKAGRLYFSKNELIEWIKSGNKRVFDVEAEAQKIISKRKGGSHE
jgi:excisionase family DNA binding protein